MRKILIGGLTGVAAFAMGASAAYADGHCSTTPFRHAGNARSVW